MVKQTVNIFKVVNMYLNAERRICTVCVCVCVIKRVRVIESEQLKTSSTIRCVFTWMTEPVTMSLINYTVKCMRAHRQHTHTHTHTDNTHTHTHVDNIITQLCPRNLPSEMFVSSSICECVHTVVVRVSPLKALIYTTRI